MDIATIIGIGAGLAIIAASILFEGSSFLQFANLPAFLIVFGGASCAALIRFPLNRVIAALALGGRIAFTHKNVNPRDIIEEIVGLANIARKQGPLGLESVEVSDPFLAKGVQMVADGFDAEALRESLERERDLNLERLEEGQRVFKALGDAGPAFGMVGTLIGLISMFGHMDDPKKIGPGMAVALLGTLYGAVLANLVALPIADKLSGKVKYEDLNQSLVIDGVTLIREGKSPNLIREMLLAYLPESHREELAEAAA